MLNLSLYPHYSIAVNYETPVDQLVLEGKYDTIYLDAKLTDQNFPSLESGSSQIDVYLINLGFKIIKSEVIKELDRVGLRPISLKELLALGTQIPTHGVVPILGMDTKWKDEYDHIRIPEIYFYKNTWHITLDFFDNISHGKDVFAATFK